MTPYYYARQHRLGFINIAKNASSSMDPYLAATGFDRLDDNDFAPQVETNVDFEHLMNCEWFYILRNPVERFAMGVVESHFSLQSPNFNSSATMDAMLALSDFAAEELCFQLLIRLKAFDNKNRLPTTQTHNPNNPPNEHMGYTSDGHTRIHLDYLSIALQNKLKTHPISIKNTHMIGNIFREHSLSNRHELATTQIAHNHRSNDAKRRMGHLMHNILIRNRDTALLEHIWNYLTPDIEHWNSCLNNRYMQEHHKHDRINT